MLLSRAQPATPTASRIMAIIDSHKDELTAILKAGKGFCPNFSHILMSKGITNVIPWIQLTTQNSANDTCAFYAFFDDVNTNMNDVLSLVKSSFCAYFWPEGECHVIAQKHAGTRKRTAVTLPVVVTASEANTESSGLSSGSVAAIVICTLLILAIILVVLYLFVFKKKTGHSPVEHHQRPEYA